MKPCYLFAAILVASVSLLSSVRDRIDPNPAAINIPVNTARAQFRPEESDMLDMLDWEEIDAWDRRVRERNSSPTRMPSDIDEVKTFSNVESDFKRFKGKSVVGS